MTPSFSKTLVLLSSLALATHAFAANGAGPQSGPPGGGGGGGSEQKPDKASTPEEEDYSETPYTDYGDFNQSEDEDEETKFLQYGRLFGVSVGAGFESADGNRGRLWQGGFPVIAVKLIYWFNFNLSIDFGITFAKHNYSTAALGSGITNVDVNFNRYGSNLRYYIDTRNMSAPLTFIGPFFEVGIANFTKSETPQAQTSATAAGVTDTDSSIGFDLGAGIEIALKPKSAYFQIEGQANFVTFKDTSSGAPANGLSDLKGRFYTLTGNLLFTW